VQFAYAWQSAALALALCILLASMCVLLPLYVSFGLFVPFCKITALQSMEQLWAHWHQTTAKQPSSTHATPAKPPHLNAPGSTTSSADSKGLGGSTHSHDADDDIDREQSLPFQQQEQQEQQQQVQYAGAGGGAGAGAGAACDHVACSQQSFCLVQELERLKRNYHGRADQVTLLLRQDFDTHTVTGCLCCWVWWVVNNWEPQACAVSSDGRPTLKMGFLNAPSRSPSNKGCIVNNTLKKCALLHTS
jgi:hypothetical protein